MPRPKVMCEICQNIVSNYDAHLATKKHINIAERGHPTEQDVINKKRAYVREYRRAHRLTAKEHAEFLAYKATV